MRSNRRFRVPTAATSAFIGVLLSSTASAGIISVEQSRNFEFTLSPGSTLNSVATNGQTFNFIANAGGRTDAVSFDQADAGIGTLVGVELALDSTTHAGLETTASNGDVDFLTTYAAQMVGSFNVDSALGMFQFEQLFNFSIECEFETAGETCLTPGPLPLPFDDSALAAPSELVGFLGVGAFDVDLSIDGPQLSTQITGNGTGLSRAPNAWLGELTLTYLYEVDMPNPVPAPAASFLLLFGLLGIGLFRRSSPS